MNKLNLLIAAQKDPQSCAVSTATNGIVDCFFGRGVSGVNPLKIAVPIVIIIIVPLLLAYWTQQVLRQKYQNEQFKVVKQQFAAASNAGLLVVLFVLMGIKQNIIIFQRPDLILKALLPLVLFYAASLGIAWMIYKMKGGAEGKAMLWGTYLRYITLALGLAISLVYQNPDYSLSVLVVVLAYLIQIPSSFWLAKKLN